jgi:hypothetical protein
MKLANKRSILLSAAVLTIAVSAHAASWTGFVTISKLEATVGDGSYEVWFTAFSNPRGCASSDFFEIKPGLASSARDSINRTLLAAFLAGKEVQFLLSTDTCGDDNRPAYVAVRIR